MKIAFIGQKGIPAQTGGVERHVEFLATYLVKLGQEVIVYNRANYSQKGIKTFKGAQLIVKPFINSKNLANITHTFLASIDVLRRKPDIVHYHGVGPSLLLWIPKIFFPKTHVVATLHSFDYDNDKWSIFAKLMLRLGEFMMCKLADEIIVLTLATQKYISDKYNRDTVLIPNGTELKDNLGNQGNNILKTFNLESNSYIFTASRLIRLKGIQYLIEAYKTIKTDKKLVIAGEGEFQNELEKLAKNDPRIIFLGNQHDEVLRQLYANAYLFVQASEMEGMSLALLEAMGHGSACLASDIPGNRVSLEETGMYFKSMDVSDLKQKLQYLFENTDEVQKMAAQSYQRAKAEFNWQTVVEKTNDLYSQLLKR